MGAFHIAGRNPAGGAADFVYKDAVMQNGDFRNREFQRAVVRYCSFFQTNMANMVISRGEDLIGNGWM
ncbi:MAG: hypothetical protein KH452_13210 [Clostridiales bacterium]|nr:hypothetical protein [Clostridiales bacterium]